jgi:TonB family protein
VDSVSDVLVARANQSEPLTPMVVVSLVGHIVLVALVLVISVRGAEPPAPKVFIVNLGGPGPKTGGANIMGGRTVERVAPPEPKAVETPPPVAPPRMALPPPEVKKPKPTPRREETRKPVENLKPTPQATGDEVRAGSTKVDTGMRGTGFGLSGGGGGAQGQVQLDVTDFCCQDYLNQVVTRIKDGWMSEQGRPGTCVVKFTIRRDGSVEGAVVERTSGFGPLDFAARRAVQAATLPRLPAQFPNEALTVHLTFEYER